MGDEQRRRRDDHRHADDGVSARRRCEAELFRAGGRDLLCDALVEATWYADLFHPWDGRGPEPGDRAAARLSILQRRLERASVLSD